MLTSDESSVRSSGDFTAVTYPIPVLIQLQHSMSFFPINPCCMEGTILPGEPKGVMETPEGKIKRYHASPSGGSQHPKSAIALFYDVFGLNIVSQGSLCRARKAWTLSLTRTAQLQAHRRQPCRPIRD